MNLLLVNYEYPPIGGGAGNATFFLAKAFHRKGIHTVVLTSSFGDNCGYKEEEGVHVYRVPALRKCIDRARLIEMMTFLASGGVYALRISRQHAIQRTIAFFTLPSGALASLIRKMHGTPYLVLLRGGDVPGHVPGLENIHRITSSARRLILRNASAVIANDEGLARKSMAVDPFPVSVIPNGVDAGYFLPARERQSDMFRILFIGRFVVDKNLFYMLDQYSKLRSEYQEKVSLRMVGDGPQRKELEAYAERLGIEQSVTWHGWVQKDELRRLYSSSSCFINPSLYEGMPNAVLEAMASGLPVVASNVPGNNTLVKDGENGYVFDLKEPDGCFRALEKMVQDPDRASTMGNQGRRHVEDNYSWDTVAEKFIQLLLPDEERSE